MRNHSWWRGRGAAAWLVAAAVLLLLSSPASAGVKGKLKKMSSAERDHYTALRVFMDKADKKAFFKLKTEDARNAWLKKQTIGQQPPKSLWDLFYENDEEMRDEILGGAVAVGWTQDQVLMAWGMPFERKRLTGRPATRSELFIYRFEVDWEGYVTVYQPGSKTAYKAEDLYRVELVMDDNVVTEVTRKDGFTEVKSD